ncbi:hypothetical protein FD755_019059 [Muntiacus reevesi]|uniref:ADAMTS/ADAMTS-like cysteine-rich domain-containing protein n=1 Tax=Muntiacus reevesi TaxID=9886 RepID=A0A5N3X5X6_MUNRE|nr:hypothetical protein FD755_019059 [Muntiacus reevesi]
MKTRLLIILTYLIICLQCRRPWFDPWVGKIPWRGKSYPFQYSCLESYDCPPDAEDFRAQQCSAYNDVQYQGRYYEWLPQYNDPAAPCALRCQARGQNLVVELAPKVLDGTRCTADSLDMCISGICQAVGCDRQLGSNAKEDNCGVCAGDGATCRLVRGQSKSHVSPEKSRF